MSMYKFTYFNVPTRGDTARMLFVLAGVPFEDNRIDDILQWNTKHKPDSLYGQLPLLEVDGVTFCQSKAIERLLAKRFGLYGSTDLEQAKADMVIDCSLEIRNLLVDLATKVYFSPAQNKAEILRDFMEGKVPTMIANLAKMVNDKGHFIGDKNRNNPFLACGHRSLYRRANRAFKLYNAQLSWPDVDFFNIIDISEQDICKVDLSGFLVKYPNLQKLVENVKENTNISNWLKHRPKTMMKNTPKGGCQK